MTRIRERLRIKTEFRVIAIDREGNRTLVHRGPNLITTLGLASMAAVWGSNFSLGVSAPIAAPRYIAVGSGVTLVPEENQVQLENEVYRKEISPIPCTYVDSTVTFQTILDFNEPTGDAQPFALSEAALFSGYLDPDFDQVMVSRILAPTPLVKTTGIQFLLMFLHSFSRGE